MGNLTDHMTRLRGEVDALRGARGALIQDLTRGARDLAATVSAMRADFTSAHAAMAKQTRGEREDFVAAVISEVNDLMSAFSRGRDDMARKGRSDRGVFLLEMRRRVMDMCKDTADDLMGARLVWRGGSPGKSRPAPTIKKPVVAKLMSLPLKAAPKKTAEAPEIKTEARKKTFAAPKAPAVAIPKVKASPMISASKTPFRKRKEKSPLDEKPAKAITGTKRGRK